MQTAWDGARDCAPSSQPARRAGPQHVAPGARPGLLAEASDVRGMTVPTREGGGATESHFILFGSVENDSVHGRHGFHGRYGYLTSGGKK